MNNLIERLRAQRTTLDTLINDLEKEVYSDIPATPETPGIGDRPDVQARNQKLQYIPFAEQTEKKIKTQGKYARGYPEGAIIHYNSGQFLKGDKDALSCVSYLAKEDPETHTDPKTGLVIEKKKWPYPCLVISTTGKIFQSFPLTEWGYHCATAHHKTHLGIEICSAGDVKKLINGKYESWFKEQYTEEQVRYCDGSDDRPEGYYTKATPEQETSLINLLLWLKSNNEAVFDFDNVLGHSTVLPKNKKDVGGSLSMPLSDLRIKLKAMYAIY